MGRRNQKRIGEARGNTNTHHLLLCVFLGRDDGMRVVHRSHHASFPHSINLIIIAVAPKVLPPKTKRSPTPVFNPSSFLNE